MDLVGPLGIPLEGPSPLGLDSGPPNVNGPVLTPLPQILFLYNHV